MLLGLIIIEPVGVDLAFNQDILQLLDAFREHFQALQLLGRLHRLHPRVNAVILRQDVLADFFERKIIAAHNRLQLVDVAAILEAQLLTLVVRALEAELDVRQFAFFGEPVLWVDHGLVDRHILIGLRRFWSVFRD